MKEFYTPAEAAELTGASKPALRSYTGTYARFFSTDATPEQGKSRRFSEADLKLIAYIRYMTITENLSHEDTIAALNGEALERFEWNIPEGDHPPIAPSSPQASNQASAMLVPYAQVQALQALLQDTQRREAETRAEARERELQLQERINQREQASQEHIQRLERELGKTQGELTSLKTNRRKLPKWWITLFGGRTEE